MGVEHFVPKSLVESFTKGHLVWLAKLDKTKLNAVFFCPGGEVCRGWIRAIVVSILSVKSPLSHESPTNGVTL